MRIGLASDTHGNVDGLERALALFERAGVERVFFLGGRLADLDAAMARRRGRTRDAPAARAEEGFLSAFRTALAHQAGGGAAADALEGRIVRVASKACAEYESGRVPRKQMDLAEGRICCLVHDKAELTRDDIANASVLFHGNSASPALVQIGPRCFVTPGHLRAPAPEGSPATCAVLECGARELVLTVFSDAGVELRQERAALASAGKMSVR